MKSRVRQLALLVLRGLGLVALLRFLRRREVIIMTLHGVMDERDNPSWTPLRPRMSRRALEAHVRALSKCYNLVSLEDAAEMLAGTKPLRPYSLAFTFDDGCRNNMTHALPILRKYRASATLFLPTGYVSSRRPFWFDRLDYAIQHVPVDGCEVRVGTQSVRLSTRDRSALRETFKRLRAAAKSEDRPDGEFAREMEDLASTMEVEAGRSLMDVYEQDDWTAVLTWEEIDRSDDDGVTFGSHTVDHVRLGRASLDVVRGQLLRSRKAIEDHTHRPCRLLCYPNGSYNAEVAELARECGYACAVTTREGTNRVGDDPMTLRRIALPDDGSATEALARASGLSELIHRAKAGLVALVKGKPRRPSSDGAAR